MAVMALAALFLASNLAAAATTTSSGRQKKASAPSSSSKSAKSKAQRSGKKKRYSSRRWKSRGQQAIKEDRAREIQAALIREHYLTGEPTGKWDERTKQALARYQADRGWQSKRLPDSRALIQLGLGPTHEGLLNPESVASTQPPSAAAPPDSPSLSSPR
jgi:peptidoglycan hydrolase-like protein with peptidoglycan-binding domain